MTAEISLGSVMPFEQLYWDALKVGRLDFQRCTACGNAWLPPREECPECWVAAYEWESAVGGGVIVSWVIYHIELHPALRDRIPYNVAIIRLDEGPQLISNIVKEGIEEVDHSLIQIGARVALEITERYGTRLPMFRLADI